MTDFLTSKPINRCLFFFQHQTKLPKKLEYAIRMPSSMNWLTGQLFDTTRVTKYARSDRSPYETSCFLAIQNNIERTFIKKTSNKDPPKIQIQRFPYPEVYEDNFNNLVGQYFPDYFAFCMLLSMKNIIKVSHWLA